MVGKNGNDKKKIIYGALASLIVLVLFAVLGYLANGSVMAYANKEGISNNKNKICKIEESISSLTAMINKLPSSEEIKTLNKNIESLNDKIVDLKESQE